MWAHTPGSRVSRLGYVAAVVALLVLVGSATSCGSSLRVTTGPTPTKCQVVLTAPSSVVAADGGAGTIAVATPPECTWSATTNASWITGLSPQSGQGSANIEFKVTPNVLPTPREGQIAVNDAQVQVQQQPAACNVEVAPRAQTLNATAGSGEVAVTTLSGCSWSAASDAAWITITSGHSGSGNGVVRFAVSANTAASRSASLIVAGQVSIIDQMAELGPPGCSYTLSPTTASVAASGAAGTVTVQAPADCSWTARSLVPWITIVSGANGRGSGVVSLVVAPNSDAPRTGTAQIAGQTFTVSQVGGCSFSISPATQSIGPSGGQGNPVAVSTRADCVWTATSNVPWTTVTSGASGSGPGSVVFSVTANSEVARTGTLTIAGHTFTITQASGCTFSIGPTSQSVGAPGGTGRVAVKTGSGCAWAATSQVSWITIVSGASGSGNGDADFTVLPNGGASRTGTMTIAAQTFTVTQAAAPCTFAINPTSISVDYKGRTGEVDVVTASHCAWTANSNVPWISIESGASGTGSGKVFYRIERNDGDDRTGTLTIAGHTFTVQHARR